jgi:hypothetical protein
VRGTVTVRFSAGTTTRRISAGTVAVRVAGVWSRGLTGPGLEAAPHRRRTTRVLDNHDRQAVVGAIA